MQFRTLQPAGGDERQVAEVIRGLMDGKSNNVGTVTIAVASATTTTINDARIGYDSVILLTPASANASGFAYYFGANAKGIATINHAANTTASRTFKYIIVG
jgi:hypothetical protein